MKKSVIFILIGLIVIGIPAYNKLTNQNLPEVEVTKPEERIIRSSILASGRLAHEEQVRLTTEVIGKVTQIYVSEGDKVKKDQLLLTLDDETYRASVEQREATVRMQEIAIDRLHTQLQNLERQWQRKKSLHDQNLLDDDAFDSFTNQIEITKLDIQSAKESLYQARAQLAQAQDQLKKTRVYAPLDGEVTSLDIKAGETAIASTTNIAGSSLMTIANPESTITEVYVDEADVADIALNQEASIVAIAYPETPITGQVKSIATTAKSVAGRQGLSFLVKLEVTDSANIELRPGMSCRAEIFTNSSKPVLSLPVQSIITEEKRSQNTVNQYVFTVENSSVKKVEIETGVSDDSYQEILSLFLKEVSVVTGPDKVLRHLKDNQEVVIKAEH